MVVPVSGELRFLAQLSGLGRDGQITGLRTLLTAQGLRVVPEMSVDSRVRKRAPVADPEARRFLRKADPVLAKLIDAGPDFRPRAWLDDLPPLDDFGTLVFHEDAM